MTAAVKVVGENDTMYQMMESDLTTNDAKYHAVRLTRQANNLTLTVDNLNQRHLTGLHSHRRYIEWFGGVVGMASDL